MARGTREARRRVGRAGRPLRRLAGPVPAALRRLACGAGPAATAVSAVRAGLVVAAVLGLGAASVPTATVPVAEQRAGVAPSTAEPDDARPERLPWPGALSGEAAALPATSGAGAQPAVLAVDAQALAANGIPARVLAAYQSAARRQQAAEPACGLTWSVLAAIGRVESDHGRDVPAGGGITPDGTITPPILGPALDGSHGWAAIPDGPDGTWARAVGPMQFLTSTWRLVGVDGNGDGRADPNNVDDAALAAARYLCAGHRVLTDPAQLTAAVLSYNHSEDYARLVLQLVARYAGTDEAALLRGSGLAPVPAASGPAPAAGVLALGTTGPAAPPAAPPPSAVPPPAATPPGTTPPGTTPPGTTPPAATPPGTTPPGTTPPGTTPPGTTPPVTTPPATSPAPVVQTVTFPALAAQTWPGPDARLVATGGGSGQPVTFAAWPSSVCRVSGSALVLTGTGTCTVAADQAAAPGFLAAPRVTRSVPVGHALATSAPLTGPAGSPVTVLLTAPSPTPGDPALTGLVLTAVAVDGTALPGGAVERTFTETPGGYRWTLATAGLSAGDHVLSVTVEGDPAPHDLAVVLG